MKRSSLLALAFVVAAVPALAEPPKTLANRNIRFGMPGEAKDDPDHKEAFLIDRSQYVLSYNNSRGTANWVSWHLSKAWLGRTVRRDTFAPDTSLPEGFLVVRPRDYQGSGFDRGHLCPAADRFVGRIDV